MRPVLQNGEHVMTRWIFQFTGKDGRSMSIEEIGWQRRESERIAQEEFFYDPAQTLSQRIA